MKTGIIIEINERFLTLLTPDGEFMRALKHNRPYTLGEEISFSPMELERKRWSFLPFFQTFKGKAVVAAGFAIILAVSTFLPMYQDNKVYAYMSIDVNPSIELAVNDDLQVVELIPYNNEGKEIIEEIKDWKKSNIEEVTKKILSEIDEKGFTDKNQEIIIAKVYAGKREKVIDRKLNNQIKHIKNEVKNEKIDVNVVEATQEEREKAKKQGLTTGKYIEQKTTSSSTQTLKSKPSVQKQSNQKTEKAVKHPSKLINENKNKYETKKKKELQNASIKEKSKKNIFMEVRKEKDTKGTKQGISNNGQGNKKEKSEKKWKNKREQVKHNRENNEKSTKRRNSGYYQKDQKYKNKKSKVHSSKNNFNNN
ncbi:anti-sigma factor domain-containing protein [Bacillus massilinigeriensis]|uniref:anti-sigma factor domain-containing protein n=1 Tax=Bacillus massilionigeriensis TaxID=1805475 RepID=UPI00096AE83E|nr:anti-sigma factor domain-containing protein [Bacillus massilionigeriensis]